MIRDALTVLVVTLALSAGLFAVGQCTACVNTTKTPPTNIGDASDASIEAVCAKLVQVRCGSSESACRTALHNEIFGANDAGGLQTVDLACMLRATSATEAAGCHGIGICPP